jgi:hypothetical protein
MQRDFHFYAIGILANHAGYSDDEAIVIATASQYVDHATESFSIQFDDEKIVETTMTAHYHIKAFDPSVQKKVYMCFHFPPEGHITVDGKRVFSFKTKENSEIINVLLKEILKDKAQGAYDDLIDNNGIPFYLYRLGVAMHTLADSWSHNSFTGRHNDENDVGKIWFKKGTKWERQYVNDWKHDAKPAIGHLECGDYPDHPFRRMQYELCNIDDNKYKKLTRTNTTKFKHGAKKCLEWLRNFKDGDGNSLSVWDENSPAMKCIDLLTKIKQEDKDERIRKLKVDKVFVKHFSSLFAGNNDYDKKRWRNSALVPKELNDPWGEFKRRDMLHAQSKPGFEKSSFRLFHKAAKLQRSFILDKLFW